MTSIKEEIEEFKGFPISIEPLFDPDIYKIFSDAYCNKTKDLTATNYAADKILKLYPLNLLALCLKAESRVGIFILSH